MVLTVHITQQDTPVTCSGQSVGNLSPFPPGTLFTYVADITDRDGELRTERFQRLTRDDAVRSAEEACRPSTLRTLHRVQEDWESAAMPDGQIVSWHEHSEAR